MFFDRKIVAQVTIEYLVILAVVVVISLVVVGLFVNMTDSPSQEIIDSSDKLGTSSTGGISVVEAVIDSAGDSLIKLSNRSSDAITLTKISVGGVDNEFSEQLVGLDSKVISLSGLSSGCTCSSGQKTVKCEYVITYVQNGITKTDRINKTIECVNDSTPVDPGKVVGLGSGTLTDPWVINNCQELQNINLNLDGNYSLGADINCYETRNWNNGAGFTPIANCGGDWWDFGSTDVLFTGSFNGNNHVISNLKINLSSSVVYVGLFGFSKGNISNVGLENLDITAPSATDVGGLAGYQEGGTISNVYIDGNVTGNMAVGGLVGEQRSGIISNSHSTSNVNGVLIVGGLVGWQEQEISNSYATGNINEFFEDMGRGQIGGLVGEGYGTISNSYATGNVMSDVIGGSSDIGGLVGKSGAAHIISNSYATGNVTGGGTLGGLVGGNDNGEIYNSYSTGNVTGSGVYAIGGLVGEMVNGISSNSYWFNSINSCCGQIFSGSCTNCTKVLDVNAFYPRAGLAYDYNVPMQHNIVAENDWTFGIDKNWTKINNTYPLLSWQ